MSEQLKPCLLELVDRVDSGIYDESTANEVARRAWFNRKPSATPEATSYLLKCEIGDCALNACIKQTSDADPHTLFVTNSSEDTQPYAYGSCRPAPVYEGLPNMIDGQSCTSTAAVYGLRKLGLEFTTEEIDAMSGRLPGKFGDSEQSVNLENALLAKGLRIKEIHSSDQVDFMKYCQLDTPLSYQDYRQEMMATVPERDKQRYETWFETERTEANFLELVAKERAKLPLYEKYIERGSLVIDRQKITFDLLQKQLSPTAYVECLLRSTFTQTEHAVCVEGLRQVNGGWLLEFFDPGNPSAIHKRRAKEIGDLLYLPAGITVYSLSKGSSA